MQLTGIKGLGEKRKETLENMGIWSVDDLLGMLPVSYRNYSDMRQISTLSAGMEVCFAGSISRVQVQRVPGKPVVVQAFLQEDGATLPLTFFNMPWMTTQLQKGKSVRFFGRIQARKDGLFCVNPTLLRGDEPTGLTAIYKPLPRIGQSLMRDMMAAALAQSPLEETLPLRFVQEHGLMSRKDALHAIHFPQDEAQLRQGQRRLSFEELILMQSYLTGLRGKGNTSAYPLPHRPELLDAFCASLPFALTGAQTRSLQEIIADMQKPIPMARLVQGDVGSGKTAVAFAALYLCAKCALQGAMMAPTEILAAQHYESAQAMLSPLGIHCGLLTGSLSAKKKADARKKIISGEWQVIFGTHALITENVAFAHLGLAITDEQHRFGVRQRTALSQKGISFEQAHVLVMSATPIPRSLSLVLYGDLDISLIDELPPGRKPIATHVIPDEKRDDLWNFVRVQVKEGRQAYVICPLVEASDVLEAQSAQQAYDALRIQLDGISIGLLHGRLKPTEKEKVLGDFYQNKTQVLVSTTVVEVGVNVPNATILIIENPERFGLAQLHQLRGRVGRGPHQSYCFLLGREQERLKILTQTQDGFRIAQTDLDQRGPGEFLGTRQSGMPDLPCASLSSMDILKEASDALKGLLRDPQSRDEAEALLVHAQRIYGHKMADFARN